MCLVCLFALFDIISATPNSSILRCYCCFNPRRTQVSIKLVFIITSKKCIMLCVDVKRKIFVIICIVIVSIENYIVSHRKTNK
jgi:hypothetical protein